MLEKPSASITGARLQDAGLTQVTMFFDVRVNNPYTLPLPMSNVDYALSSSNHRFLSGEADVQGTAPAKGSKTLGVPVRISYVELIKAVKAARPGATIPYTANLGLSVDVPLTGPLRVPMSREGSLTVSTAPGLLEQLKSMAP